MRGSCAASRWCCVSRTRTLLQPAEPQRVHGIWLTAEANHPSFYPGIGRHGSASPYICSSWNWGLAPVDTHSLIAYVFMQNQPSSRTDFMKMKISCGPCSDKLPCGHNRSFFRGMPGVFAILSVGIWITVMLLGPELPSMGQCDLVAFIPRLTSPCKRNEAMRPGGIEPASGEDSTPTTARPKWHHHDIIWPSNLTKTEDREDWWPPVIRRHHYKTTAMFRRYYKDRNGI